MILCCVALGVRVRRQARPTALVTGPSTTPPPCARAAARDLGSGKAAKLTEHAEHTEHTELVKKDDFVDLSRHLRV